MVHVIGGEFLPNDPKHKLDNVQTDVWPLIEKSLA